MSSFGGSGLYSLEAKIILTAFGGCRALITRAIFGTKTAIGG